MSPKKIPLLLSVAILTVMGIAMLHVMAQTDAPPAISISIEPEFPRVSYRPGVKVFFILSITDNAPLKSDVTFTSSPMKYPVFSEESYGCKGKTSCSVSKTFYPAVPGEHFITATVTDSVDQTTTKTVNFTAVACSSDADCGDFVLLKAGSYCGIFDPGKILEYGSEPRCMSGGVCDAAGVERVKQVCAEGQACYGSQPEASCITASSASSSVSSGTPACTPNGPIRSICMCGSEQYGYEPNSYFYKEVNDHSGYCCSDNGKYTYNWPGPCSIPPSANPASSAASSAFSAPSSREVTPLCSINEAIRASCMCDTTRWESGYCCHAPAGYLFHTTPGPCSAVDNPPPPSSPQAITTVPTISPSQPIFSPPTSPLPPTAVPTAMHPVPSPDHPKAQMGSSTVQKNVNKAWTRALQKRQQALRRELRSLERSLLRKKNSAALGQVADLRDELMNIDLRDTSAVEALRSLQGEITALRIAVLKKGKRGSQSGGIIVP